MITAARRGTNDAHIVAEVCRYNTYQIPPKLPGAIVVDVGCHIGSFVSLCLERGTEKVFAYEASRENATLARRNLAAHNGSVRIRHAAIVRSDCPPECVSFSGFSKFDNGLINTGGGNVYADDGDLCLTKTLDAAIDEAGRVDVLKLDCEGSEFPALLTCNRLDKVDYICGEYHEFTEDAYRDLPTHFRLIGRSSYRVEDLEIFLMKRGFSFSSDRHGMSNIGRFFARRTR